MDCDHAVQGQGIANAVGMAIANKQLAARYNKPDHEIVNNTIWCFTGDGCIQEGVGQEGEQCSGPTRGIGFRLTLWCA